MEVEVTEITNRELEYLLATASYGSSWLECHILKSESILDNLEDFNDREEHWAHRLLNGGHLVCYDHYDEDDEDNPVEHKLSMDDFYRGFAKSIKECPVELANVLSEEGDYCDADAVMQVILFGEVIYG